MIRYRPIMRWQPDSPFCAECGFDWNMARRDATDPEFGALGALEIIRRNAHEVHHHLMDISRR